MFSNLSFIGKWKHWYRVLRATDSYVCIPWGMGCGWPVAEGEDSSWLEWKR